MGSVLFWGANFSLRAFDAAGKELWMRPTPGANQAWDVNITSDGRLVVVAYADGTIRWHRKSDGFEILALQVLSDNFPSLGPVVSGKVARLYWGEAAAPKKGASLGQTSDLGRESTSLEAVPVREAVTDLFTMSVMIAPALSRMGLGAAGLIGSPMSSTEFRKYGRRGRGKWITVYARKGHTFAVIAGLRLDTTPYDNYTGRWAPGGSRPIVLRGVLWHGIR